MEEYVILNPDGSTEKLWSIEETTQSVLAKRFLIFDKKTHGKKYWARKLFSAQIRLAFMLISNIPD